MENERRMKRHKATFNIDAYIEGISVNVEGSLSDIIFSLVLAAQDNPFIKTAIVTAAEVLLDPKAQPFIDDIRRDSYREDMTDKIDLSNLGVKKTD